MRPSPRSFPHTIVVQQLRDVAGRDRYNNEVRARSAPLTEMRVRMVPLGSSEQLDGREELKGRYIVIAPRDADLSGVDEFTWQGTRFRVDGPPRPTSAIHGVSHLELDAFMVTG